MTENTAEKFKSKWFRVAVAGDTTDGREIQSESIIQMAQTYNLNTYGARINLEHIKGVSPDGIFGAYGDVIALKTEKVTINGEQKDALFAQIQPNENLIALNQKSKIYTSIEVDENFAKTGQAYLVGLAVTDSPASLGTEMLSLQLAQMKTHLKRRNYVLKIYSVQHKKQNSNSKKLKIHLPVTYTTKLKLIQNSRTATPADSRKL